MSEELDWIWKKDNWVSPGGQGKKEGMDEVRAGGDDERNPEDRLKKKEYGQMDQKWDYSQRWRDDVIIGRSEQGGRKDHDEEKWRKRTKIFKKVQDKPNLTLSDAEHRLEEGNLRNWAGKWRRRSRRS